jgi:hypothetical protein
MKTNNFNPIVSIEPNEVQNMDYVSGDLFRDERD